MSGLRYEIGNYEFRPEGFFPRALFDRITEVRVTRPEVIEEEATARRRREHLIREPGPQYGSTLGLVPLERVANAVRQVPDEFIAPAGNDVTPAYLSYIRPLIGPPLPEYARLVRVPVPARLV